MKIHKEPTASPARVFGDCSLVIPTVSGREDQLSDLLYTLAHQRDKPREVIIITDSPEPLIRALLSRPEVRGINSKLIGVTENESVSVTRNAGMANSSGKNILFLDDDVIPTDDWLSAMHMALERGADIVGGVIEPMLLVGNATPVWWDEVIIGPYLTVGNRHLIFKGHMGYGLWAANLGIRRTVATSIHFNPNLGLRKSRRVYGEDTDFVLRAISHGFRARLSEDAVVYHKIPRERLTLEYLRLRAWHEGHSMRHGSRYGAIAVARNLILRFVRGFYFAITRGNALALAVHSLLVSCTGLGYLGIRRPHMEENQLTRDH